MDFAHLMAKVFSVEDAKIKSVSQQDIPGLAEIRPSDLTMDLKKIKSLGFEAKGAEEELTLIARNQ